MASVPTVWTALRSPRSERSGGFSPICPPAQAGGPHRRAGWLRALLALRPPAAWKREPLPGRIRRHVGPIRPGRTKEKPGRNPLPHPFAVPRHGNGFPLSALSSRGGICGPNFGSALEQFFFKIQQSPEHASGEAPRSGASFSACPGGAPVWRRGGAYGPRILGNLAEKC